MPKLSLFVRMDRYGEALLHRMGTAGGPGKWPDGTREVASYVYFELAKVWRRDSDQEREAGIKDLILELEDAQQFLARWARTLVSGTDARRYLTAMGMEATRQIAQLQALLLGAEPKEKRVAPPMSGNIPAKVLRNMRWKDVG